MPQSVHSSIQVFITGFCTGCVIKIYCNSRLFTLLNQLADQEMGRLDMPLFLQFLLHAAVYSLLCFSLRYTMMSGKYLDDKKSRVLTVIEDNVSLLNCRELVKDNVESGSNILLHHTTSEEG